MAAVDRSRVRIPSIPSTASIANDFSLQTAPFLLRVFLRPQSHHELGMFADPALLAKDEYSIYAWKDMTLREIVMQIRSVATQFCSPGNAKFSVRHIYEASPSMRDREASRFAYDYKDLGFVFARVIQGTDPYRDSGKSRVDPSLKTLEQHRFIPGDFLDVAYLTHAPPSSMQNGSMSAAGSRGPPSSSFTRSAGPSDADRAWGVAGDRAFDRRRTSAGRGDVLSGSNRANARSEISIIGAGRNSRANGQDADRRRGNDEDENMD